MQDQNHAGNLHKYNVFNGQTDCSPVLTTCDDQMRGQEEGEGSPAALLLQSNKVCINVEHNKYLNVQDLGTALYM